MSSAKHDKSDESEKDDRSKKGMSDRKMLRHMDTGGRDKNSIELFARDNDRDSNSSNDVFY